jgi:transcriptional regulator with XRE-family HTH domain
MSGEPSPVANGTRAHSRDTELLAKLLGERIRLARRQRHWSEIETAERARVSRATLQKIEKGGLGVALGLVLEVCVIVGVPLLGVEDAASAAARLDRTRLQLASLPKRIRRAKSEEFDDDF